MSFLQSFASTPHFAVPFQFGPSGGALTVEQDSLDEVAACVEILLSTTLGSRDDIPTYGVADQTFAQQFDPSLITAAVATWEPRAVVTVQTSPGRSTAVTVNVQLASGVTDVDSSAVGIASDVPTDTVVFDGGVSFDFGWTWDS
jgi:phage baseplate assembly protein W